MKDLDHILVPGCPLCDLYLISGSCSNTTIHYLESNTIDTSDFIIINCNNCGLPLVVPRDHTITISKDMWGRILYQCRKLFGENMRLRCKARNINDHWHAHVIR